MICDTANGMDSCNKTVMEQELARALLRYRERYGLLQQWHPEGDAWNHSVLRYRERYGLLQPVEKDGETSLVVLRYRERYGLLQLSL